MLMGRDSSGLIQQTDLSVSHQLFGLSFGLVSELWAGESSTGVCNIIPASDMLVMHRNLLRPIMMMQIFDHGSNQHAGTGDLL